MNHQGIVHHYRSVAKTPAEFPQDNITCGSWVTAKSKQSLQAGKKFQCPKK